MPTVLLFEDEAQRINEVRSRLRAALPSVRVQLVSSAVEFRYAFVTQSPQVVVIGAVPSASKLAWEVAALRPSTKIIVLAGGSSCRESWQAFGDSIFDVVSQQDIVAAVAAATSTRPLPGLGALPALQPGDGARLAKPLASEVPTMDRHRMKNRLAGLLAGLHAMAAELRATATETDRVPEVADEYVDRLVDVVGDICAMVAAAEARPCDENHG